MSILLAGVSNDQTAVVAKMLNERHISFSSVFVENFIEPRLQVGAEEFIGVTEIEEVLPELAKTSEVL